MSKLTKPARARKPTNKHVLEIHFDTKVGVDNFMAWYLDGGGERYSNYYSKSWGKDWMFLQPSEHSCPKCEFPNDHLREFYDDRTIRTMEISCGNCNHEYEIESPYEP